MIIQTRHWEGAVKDAGFPNINNACKFAKFYHLLVSWNSRPMTIINRVNTEVEVIQLLNCIDCYNQLEALKLPNNGWERLSYYAEIKAWWLTNCSHL